MQEQSADEAGVRKSNIVITVSALWFVTRSIQMCSICMDVPVKSRCQWVGRSDTYSLNPSFFRPQLLHHSSSIIRLGKPFDALTNWGLLHTTGLAVLLILWLEKPRIDRMLICFGAYKCLKARCRTMARVGSRSTRNGRDRSSQDW